MSNDLATRFCDRPWTFLEIQEKSLYNCCPRWVNLNEIGDITPELDFAKEWNSDRSKAFRRTILDGSFSMCNKEECPMIQNKTLPKRTDILNGKHGERLKQIVQWDLEISDLPATINLCYDRSCNLECPSCRSKKIFYNDRVSNLTTVNKKDTIKFYSNRSDFSVPRQKPRQKNFPERYKQVLKINDKLLQMIHSKPHDVNLIITGSGDPFGAPSFFQLMKKIKPHLNPKITLALQTNGVLWDEKRWAKLKNIHTLNISAIISLDAGIKEHYDKVRVGGDWNRLMKNLTFIKSLNLPWVRLDMCVQKNNYQSIPEFIEIAKQHNFDSYTSRIFNWGTFTEGKFDEHNIFDKKHPEHKEMMEIINRDYQYDKHDWGNLTDFIK